MIKRILVLLLIFIAPLIGHATCLRQHPIRSSFELREIVATAQKLPEAKIIFEKVLEEGPLFVKVNRHISREFEGYWSDEDRTIYLTLSPSTTRGSLIGTLVFELHNAYRNEDLCALTEKAGAGKISRADFVREYEYVEFKNAKDTEKLIALGKERGVYPPSSNIYYFNDFEDHYVLQQETGHSAWIGQMYDGYYSHN